MIDSVHIQNYKSLRDVSIDLERFTVFVGPNGSGKSSALQALDQFCRVFRIPSDNGVDQELKKSMSRGVESAVEFQAISEGHRYKYRSRSAGPRRPVARDSGWNGEGRGYSPDLDSEAWYAWKPDPTSAMPVPESLLLRLEASKLVQPGPSGQDASVMSADGSGLHSALAGLTLNDPDSWAVLQRHVHRLIPSIKRLRFTKALTPHQPPALLFDTVGADSVPADQVSEGTLLVVGLLTAIYRPVRPEMLLLDDLDRGLHPKAQSELVSLLREILAENKNLQIVATTHSPYLLDCMEPQEVRMTQLAADGSTVCAPLTRHPGFDRWKKEFAPGEMWSIFGEKWVIDPEAANV